MSKAEITRQRIINAAILSLAGEDMFHRIQLDHLAEKAGVSAATVRYHFNSKDKFLLAVWNCIVKEREPYTLEHFYQHSKQLLETWDGQRKFIHDMLEQYCIFFRGEKDERQRRLIRLLIIELFNFVRSPIPYVDEYLNRELMIFHEICRKICGEDDFYETSLWYLFIMHPLAVSFSHQSNPRRFRDPIRTDDFENRILNCAEQQLLTRLHLNS